MAGEIQERIKRCRWVRIQKRLAQARLAGFTYGYVFSFVPIITETQFPVPSLEVIANFSHLTAEPDIEDGIPVSELFMSGPGVVKPPKLNTCSHRETASVRKEIWNSRICNGEWIKRIYDRHTEAVRTETHVGTRYLEWIRRKRHSRQGGIEE